MAKETIKERYKKARTHAARVLGRYKRYGGKAAAMTLLDAPKSPTEGSIRRIEAFTEKIRAAGESDVRALKKEELLKDVKDKFDNLASYIDEVGLKNPNGKALVESYGEASKNFIKREISDMKETAEKLPLYALEKVDKAIDKGWGDIKELLYRIANAAYDAYLNELRISVQEHYRRYKEFIQKVWREMGMGNRVVSLPWE